MTSRGSERGGERLEASQKLFKVKARVGARNREGRVGPGEEVRLRH